MHTVPPSGRIHRFQTRIAALIVIAAAPGFALAIYNYWEQHQHQATQAKHAVVVLGQLLKSRYEQIAVEGRLALESVARLPAGLTRDRARCDAALADMRRRHKAFVNVAIAAPDGVIACSALPSEGRVSVADRLYFREAMKTRDFAIGDYQIGRITGKATVNFAYPMLEQGLPGVAILALDFAWIEAAVAEAALPAGAAVTLVRADGMVLARYPQPEDWLGRTFPEMGLMHANLEARTLAAAKGPDGAMRYYAFGTLRAAGGGPQTYLSVEIPEASLFADVRRGLLQHLALLGAVAALMIAAAVAAGRAFVLRPLHALGLAARRFADGDHDARSGLDYTTGELGRLAQAFDHMARSLQQALVERDRALEEISNAGSRMRALIQASPLAIYTLDLEHRMTSWNAAAEKLYGWTEQELLGRTLPMVPEGGRTPEHYALRERVLEGEVISNLETQRRRRDGVLLDVSLSMAPLYDAEGRVCGRMSIVADVTERKHMEEALHRAHAEMSALIRAAPLAIYTLDLDSRITSWSPAAERLYGWKEEELLGRYSPLVPGGQRTEADHDEVRRRIREGERTTSLEVQRERRDGALIYVTIARAPLYDAEGQVCGRMVIASDITSRKKTEAELVRSLSLLQATLDATADGILLVDTEGRIVRYNARFTQMWCIPDDVLAAGEVAGALQFVMTQLKDPEGFLARVKEIYAHPEAESRDIVELADGRAFERYSQPQRIEGAIAGRVWSFSDITEQRQAEDRLTRLAQYDTLTGLPNRSLFHDRLLQAMARAARHETMVALMFVDLDNFKTVNDTLGHQAGDALLQEVARRLTGCLRETDTVARRGGDEFTVMLEEVMRVDQVGPVAEKIIAALREAAMINGKAVAVSASIGITLYPFDTEDIDEMLIQADTAMYRAKERGRNNFQFFSHDMNRRA
ncbi:MAG: PAS domain S-box protein [Betaproteobacteria bacterium]|nr:PAS domain S-box protein [Betaproteobacteria bacterium]